MAACLTFKRRRNPEVLDSSWFWLCSCFARLSRYKVLLLKPHLRDMLALARRRRAIQLFNYIQWFVGFSWFFFKIRCLISANDVTPEFYICACMEWYGLWFTVILLTKMRLIEIGRMWRNLHLLKAATKHREKAGIWGFVGLEWWSQWGNFWIFLAAVGPVKLVFLLEAQACSSRNLLTYCSSAEFGSNMFLDNVWQAQASFLQTTCRIQMRKTMRRASWACLGLFGAPFLQIHIMSHWFHRFSDCASGGGQAAVLGMVMLVMRCLAVIGDVLRLSHFHRQGALGYGWQLGPHYVFLPNFHVVLVWIMLI